MPRFFFDILDGPKQHRDARGIVLPAVGRVWEIAVPMVEEIAKSRDHLHPPHAISVVVRDEDDVVVYRSDSVVRRQEADRERSIVGGADAGPQGEPSGRSAAGPAGNAGRAAGASPRDPADRKDSSQPSKQFVGFRSPIIDLND